MQYPHRCTINRLETTWTDGEAVKTPTAVATNVQCWLQENRGQIGDLTTGAQLEYDAVMFFPFPTDVRPQGGQSGESNKDQLVMTRHPVVGLKLLVQHVRDTSGKAHHLTAYVKHVKAR